MRKGKRISRIMQDTLQNQLLLVIFIIYFIVVAFVKPTFVSADNMKSVLVDASIYGMSALAMTIAIICGEFDLSLSSNFAWAQIFLCYLLNVWGSNTLGVVCAILTMLLSCMAIGAVNGLIVVKCKISAFITTLGMMTIVKGICLVFTDGEMISTSNTVVKSIGKGTLLGIPYLVLMFVIMILAAYYVMHYTRFGRGLYATGGNYEAASLTGIPVKFNKFIIFVILGMAAGISGFMFVCLMRAGSVLYGTDLSLTCVAATVVGGTPLCGGKGSVLKTVFGILVIYVLYKSLSFLGVQGYYTNLIKGLVLLSVVSMDAYMSERRKERARA